MIPVEKKPPRFVPTLTEVVPGKPQPLTESPLAISETPEADQSSDIVLTKAQAAAEAFIAQRLPELVSQHMLACELRLRQELEVIIKNVVESQD